ncbi:Small_GTPase [Hexamita inflata]|uniref:Small GTPase n=1 Tax=Hexamita inflata TaxID=28002 RepID=A0AA86RJA9_9EUKA|nr:Small GTPase [Hexamita inflata]
MRTYKIVVVGDEHVGKSSLIRVMSGHEFPDNPYTIFSDYSREVTVISTQSWCSGTPLDN